MVFFNPISGKGPVQPIAGGIGGVNGPSAKPPIKPAGVDAFTPSFGAAAASSTSGSTSIADIVANVGKLSASDARGQLSKGTLAGLDSFASIHDAL